MTFAKFETASLADVLKKAASVAPSKGEAFDKAAGLVITIQAPEPGSSETHAIIQATNLDLYYKEWLPVLETDATMEISWRVAAKISQLISSLPIGSGKTVTLDDTVNARGRTLTVLSGRMKNNWQLLPLEYYPEWDTFDPEGLTEIENFGNRLKMVEWAASSDDSDIPLNGVNMDGEHAVATDIYRLARVPLPFSGALLADGPITIPARLLSNLIKQTGSVSVGATDSQLLVMPDENVQIRTVLYGVPYKTAGVAKLVANEYPNHFEVPKGLLLDLLNRAGIMLSEDRFPLLDIFIGKGQIAVYAVAREQGTMGDQLLLPNFADHKLVNIIITPRFLVDAITNCPADRIYFFYDASNGKKILRISDGGGYNCWVMPRSHRPSQEEQEAELAKEAAK